MASGKMIAEFRLAARTTIRGGATPILAIVMLTIAMITCTVAFSFVDNIVLRPLPFSDPDRLVSVSFKGRSPDALRAPAPKDYFDWIEGSTTLQTIGASRPNAPLALEFNGGMESLSASRVTTNLFAVLGVNAVIGRLFNDGDKQPQSASTVILSFSVWSRLFGENPKIIGTILKFADGPREVVGVLPPGISYPMTAGTSLDIYVPYTETALETQNSGAMVLSVVARLRGGVTIDRALTDLQRLSGPAVTVVPLIDRVLGPAVRGWLYLALAAVACVLCIACTNVAILLLVRGLARSPEFAIRRALGASTSLLVGRSLFEGLIISCGAASLAALLTSWVLPAVKSWIPAGFLPRLSAVTVDGRVFIVCFASALICGLSFGSAPAWLSAKANLLSPMKGRNIVVAGGTPRHGIIAWFIIGQIAAVAFLLVVATIVVRSFIVVITSDLGFNRDNLVAVTYSYSLDDIPREQRSTSVRVLRQRLIEAASAVPGVVDVGVSTNGSVPLSGSSVRYSITIADRGETLRDDMLETRMVTPGYFRTLGMRLESGRLLESSDTMGSPLVMLINDAGAARFFQGKTAVGQTVVFNGHSVRIVGVLQSVRYKGPEAEVGPEMYLPADQQPIRRSTEAGSLVFRVQRNASAVSAAVRDAIKPFLNGSEPGAPKFVNVFFNKITEGRRFNAGIMGVLGLVAVVLSAIGIYGTMAFLVGQQIRTIGVKMALGASRSSVRGEVVGLALRFVAVGTTVGCVAAWVLSKAFLPFAFGVPPGDVMTFVSVAIIITVTASIATWMPARVASSVDAADILRQQA